MSVNLGMSYDDFMRQVNTDDKEQFGVDFSSFNTDSRSLISKCRGTAYGYVRVSTDHQDYQRQIDELKQLGISEKNIFKDKKSGKDFNRDEFKRLMYVLKPGDSLVVVELDRFGRNMTEIKNHWYWITRLKQADIIVLDQPILNTNIQAHGMQAFLSEVILAVFSLMAEMERELIHNRMQSGLKRIKISGKKLGRKRLEIPLLFWEIKASYLRGMLSQNAAAKRLKVDPKTFKSWMTRTDGISTADEWESIEPQIEEQERLMRIEKALKEYGEAADEV